MLGIEHWDSSNTRISKKQPNASSRAARFLASGTVEEILANDGIQDLKPIITSRQTYIAPFVNAEECQYLVIEDNFPNGRPTLEQGGLIFTDRETVEKTEKMLKECQYKIF